jgi:hypothetical protein
VLHTNCPEHADFNDYAKCNFRLALPRRRGAGGVGAGGAGEGHDAGGEGGAEVGSAGRGGGAGVRVGGGGESEGGDVVEIGPDTRWSYIESILGPPEGGVLLSSFSTRGRGA